MADVLLELLDQGAVREALGRAAGDGVTARIVAAWGMAGQGDTAGATAVLRPLVATLERAVAGGDEAARAQQAHAILALGVSSVLGGEADAGTALLERALTLHTAAWPRAQCLRYCALALEQRGAFEGAAARYEAAAGAYRDIGHRFGLGSALYGAAAALAEAGEDARARALLAEGVEALRADGAAPALGAALALLATLTAGRDGAAALALLDEAEALTGASAGMYVWDVRIRRGDVLLDLGRTDEALTPLREARALAPPGIPDAAGVDNLLARALLDLGRVEEAAALLDESEQGRRGPAAGLPEGLRLERAALRARLAAEARPADGAAAARALDEVERAVRARVHRRGTGRLLTGVGAALGAAAAVGDAGESAERGDGPDGALRDEAARAWQLAAALGTPPPAGALATLRARGARVPIGPFWLEGRIGRGGMGEVWRARHRGGRAVAVKLLRADQGHEHAALFDAEIQAVARLDHPNVVRVLAVHRVDPVAAELLSAAGAAAAGQHALVMELVRGGALEERLHGWRWPEVRALLSDLLAGLAHAHARGVLHLDLKPGNVLVDDVGGARVPRLTDFGLAGLARRRADGRVFGTPAYMAPEQATAGAPLGPATDLYALGCLAWRLLTGRPPYEASDPVEQISLHRGGRLPPLVALHPVPRELEGWLRMLLAKRPEARFSCAADAAWALEALGEAEGTYRTFVPRPDGDTGEVAAGNGARPPAPETLVPGAFSGSAGGAPSTGDGWGDTGGGPASAVSGPVSTGTGPPGTGSGPVRAASDSVGTGASWRRAWAGAAEPPRSPGAATTTPLGRSARLAATGPLAPDGPARSKGSGGLAPDARADTSARLGDPPHGEPADSSQPRADASHPPEGAPAASDDVPEAPRAGRPPFPPDWRALSERAAPPFFPGQGEGLLAWRVGRLVGREAARDQLWNALGAVHADGVGRVVWISGAPGLGRSALLAWLAETAAATGCARIGPAARGGDRPRLVLLDDPEPAEAQEAIARYAEVRALVVVASRAAAPSGVASIVLAPLSDAEIHALLDERLPLDRALAATLAARAGGSPAFAVALLTDLVRREALEPGPEGFRTRADVEIALPDDLRALWTARLDAHAPPGSPRRSAWEIAATLGPRAALGAWAEVCARAGLRPDVTAFVPLEAEGWIGHDGDVVVFRVPAVREALRAGAAASGRAPTWHGLVADALPDGDPARGRHLAAAGRHAQALRPLRAAAAAAVNATRLDECRALLDAWDRSADALGLAADDPLRASPLVVRVHLALHTHEDPYPLLEHGLRIARGIEASQLAYTLGWVLARDERHADAEAAYLHALVAPPGVDLGELRPIVRLALAAARYALGRDADELVAELRGELADRPELLVRLDATAGRGALRLGRLARAEALLDDAVAGARRIVAPDVEAEALADLAEVRAARGEDPIPALEGAVASLGNTGSDKALRARVRLAGALLAAGRRVEAAAALAPARRFGWRLGPTDAAALAKLEAALEEAPRARGERRRRRGPETGGSG